MESNIIQSWISQPDVCRCCLSATGTWDVTKYYTTDTGIKEVFSDTLEECFGISLSRLTDWGCSRMICGLCIGHLQKASVFRKQVLEAERQFLEHLKGNTKLSTKIEEDELQVNSVDDLQDFTYDNSKEETEVDSISNGDNGADLQKKLKRMRHKKQKKKKIREESCKTTKNHSGSDKVLMQQSNVNDIVSQNKEVGNLIPKEHADIFDGNHIGNVQFCVEATHPKLGIKQVSERKRVILTCGIVLKDTTACPFRHHKSWFQCFFCSQDFMEINLLRNHLLQSHTDVEKELKNIKRYPRSLQIDISELKCRHCDVPLTDVEAMTRHFEFSHQKVIYKECIADYKVDASPYTCHLCKREFHVFRTLTTHLNEHYANCICDVCGKSFLNSKRLKVHKRTHESGNYPCSECGKILKTKTSKANHMESVHSKRVVKCQICFKPMKHYNDRIKHMSEVHNITHKFKCTICNREYNIKHYLATHMRQTHGHKNKKCLECGMAFITNHGLKKHMLRHSGEKPYSCAVCSKSYVRSSTLRDHMRTHGGDKKTLGPGKPD